MMRITFAAIFAVCVVAPVFGGGADDAERPVVAERAAVVAGFEDPSGAGGFARSSGVVRSPVETVAGDGVAGGVGTVVPASVFNPDVRIDSTRTDAESWAIDFDAATGNLFAVVQWPTTWSVYISTNNGASWAETFNFGAAAVDVDLAVVDGFVYVGYVTAGSPDDGRLRRFSAIDGSVDNAYFFQTIVQAPAGVSLTEVSVEGNQDDLDNRVYFGALLSDGTLRWAFDVASDGTTPTFIDPVVSDASSSLDMHWNSQFSTDFMYMSFIDSGGDARVLSLVGFGPWEEEFSVLVGSPAKGVRVSAFGDTVIIGYIDDSGGVDVTEYRISYNGGDTFSLGVLNTASGDNFFSPDVTARLGYGTAFASSTERGFDDEVVLNVRQNYAPGSWPSTVLPENNDVFTTSDLNVAIQALPIADPALQYAYGIAWRADDGSLRFDRVEGCPGDTNGDRLISALDISNVLGAFGNAGVTSVYGGDVTRDGTVGPLDISLVLGNFGSVCP